MEETVDGDGERLLRCSAGSSGYFSVAVCSGGLCKKCSPLLFCSSSKESSKYGWSEGGHSPVERHQKEEEKRKQKDENWDPLLAVSRRAEKNLFLFTIELNNPSGRQIAFFSASIHSKPPTATIGKRDKNRTVHEARKI